MSLDSTLYNVNMLNYVDKTIKTYSSFFSLWDLQRGLQINILYIKQMTMVHLGKCTLPRNE